MSDELIDKLTKQAIRVAKEFGTEDPGTRERIFIALAEAERTAYLVGLGKDVLALIEAEREKS